MAQGDSTHYRLQYPIAELPLDGGALDVSDEAQLSAAEYDTHAQILEAVWNEAQHLKQKARLCLQIHAATSAREVERAWRLWMQSHHTIFVSFTVLAYSYEKLIRAALDGVTDAIDRWATRVSALWVMSGALMAHGCDFSPLMSIYCTHIRSTMPCAFSGTWSREWALVHRQCGRWREMVSRRQASAVLAADNLVNAGIEKYHSYHRQVMKDAVPDGKSLAQHHKVETGSLQQPSEQEFDVYDNWFRVRRVAQNCFEFLRNACEILSETAKELYTGSRLPYDALTHIAEGIETTIRIFGEWLGDMPETSRYFRQVV